MPLLSSVPAAIGPAAWVPWQPLVGLSQLVLQSRAALASVHQGGSDTAAFGGDFAYQYGHAGAFTGIGSGAADTVLAAATFGAAAQALQSSSTLFSGARTLR